jgi:hypothetical protein
VPVLELIHQRFSNVLKSTSAHSSSATYQFLLASSCIQKLKSQAPSGMHNAPQQKQQ